MSWRAHALDAGDVVNARGSEGGFRDGAAVTSVASNGRVLLSGHGTLPFAGRVMDRKWPGGSGKSDSLRALDGDQFWYGKFLMGELNAQVDWGLADFSDSTLSATHPGTGTSAPFSVGDIPSVGDRLRHWSRFENRGAWRYGRFKERVATSPTVTLPDGSGHNYSPAWIIEPAQPSPVFSQEGDSGSLVFDVYGYAVGTVVAGDSDSGLSLVIPLGGLLRALEDAGHRQLFFA